jgi:hypothetical protein
MTTRTGWWSALLAAALLPGGAVHAQELLWQSVPASPGVPSATIDPAVRPAAATAGDPRAAAELGRPVALTDSAPPAPLADDHLSPVDYRDPEVPQLDPLVDHFSVARGADPPDTVPPPVGGAPVIPPPGGDGYNPGVVTDHPLGKSFWDKCKEFFNPNDKCSTSCRTLFQSDHAFDYLASPVTNPFFFEDPRALTEVRPLFFYQKMPSGAGGGYSSFLGTQARVAFNDSWSFVISELGGVFFHPNNPPDGLTSGDSFAQVTLGPKWTFYRNPDCNNLAAAGLYFVIPTSSHSAFQDTGDLSLVPYVSYAQNFRLGQGFGAINFMGTTGFNFSVNSQRSEYFYLSLHADYDIANTHKIYPFLEMNWYHYTSGGKGPPLGFEGGDLINFGSSNLGSRDYVSLAPGVRYKFSECIQAGFAVEFPLTGQKQLTDYRLLFDVIIRF